jgi:hypothetical protein
LGRFDKEELHKHRPTAPNRAFTQVNGGERHDPFTACAPLTSFDVKEALRQPSARLTPTTLSIDLLVGTSYVAAVDRCPATVMLRGRAVLDLKGPVVATPPPIPKITQLRGGHRAQSFVRVASRVCTAGLMSRDLSILRRSGAIEE